MRISQLKKYSPEMTKNGMEIVCVFESTMSELKSHAAVTAGDSFSVYVDEDKMKVYKEYEYEHNCLRSALGLSLCVHSCVDFKLVPSTPYVCNGCPPAACTPMLLGPRGATGLPMEVLIDEQGKISDIHYGKTIGDHMPLDKVNAFAGVAGGSPPSGDVMDR